LHRYYSAAGAAATTTKAAAARGAADTDTHPSKSDKEVETWYAKKIFKKQFHSFNLNLFQNLKINYYSKTILLNFSLKNVYKIIYIFNYLII